MLRRALLRGGLTAVALSAGIGKNAVAGQYVSEAKGYFTFEMLAVVNDPRDPMLAGFASGNLSRYDTYEGENVAIKVHHDAKAGRIRFYPGPLTVLVYVWGSSSQGLEGIRSYSNPHGGLRTERAIRPANRAVAGTFSIGPPQYIFWMRAVAKDMAIAFPDAFFTPETQVMLCAPDLPSIWPDRARDQGIWFTRGTLPWHRRQGTWVTTFFLMPSGA